MLFLISGELYIITPDLLFNYIASGLFFIFTLVFFLHRPIRLKTIALAEKVFFSLPVTLSSVALTLLGLMAELGNLLVEWEIPSPWLTRLSEFITVTPALYLPIWCAEQLILASAVFTLAHDLIEAQGTRNKDAAKDIAGCLSFGTVLFSSILNLAQIFFHERVTALALTIPLLILASLLLLIPPLIRFSSKLLRKEQIKSSALDYGLMFAFMLPMYESMISKAFLITLTLPVVRRQLSGAIARLLKRKSPPPARALGNANLTDNKSTATLLRHFLSIGFLLMFTWVIFASPFPPPSSLVPYDMTTNLIYSLLFTFVFWVLFYRPESKLLQKTAIILIYLIPCAISVFLFTEFSLLQPYVKILKMQLGVKTPWIPAIIATATITGFGWFLMKAIGSTKMTIENKQKQTNLEGEERLKIVRKLFHSELVSYLLTPAMFLGGALLLYSVLRTVLGQSTFTENTYVVDVLFAQMDFGVKHSIPAAILFFMCINLLQLMTKRTEFHRLSENLENEYSILHEEAVTLVPALKYFPPFTNKRLNACLGFHVLCVGIFLTLAFLSYSALN